MTLLSALSRKVVSRSHFLTRRSYRDSIRSSVPFSRAASTHRDTLKTSSTLSNGIVEQSVRENVVGRQMHGFTIRRTQQVPEMALHAVFLQHDETGAEYLHIARADHNNVFGVGFRTPPKDSTGVAHILEHTVLCGSRKYPVRDPFFNMLNRSLSTFMNAMTSSDWTVYPFSTLNPKDFQNLASVYLDAAFFPRLRNVDFRYRTTSPRVLFAAVFLC